MGYSRGQRRQLYVSRNIQGVVMSRFALYWIGYHFTLWHGMLLYGYVRGHLLSSFTGGGMSFWEYYARFFEVNNSVLICAAVICPIMLWDTLRVTHRIAGPVVRFKNTLKRLSRGEQVDQIHLRDKDLMCDLCDAFNEYLASRHQQNPGKKPEVSTKDLNQILGRISKDETTDAEEDAPVTSSSV